MKTNNPLKEVLKQQQELYEIALEELEIQAKRIEKLTKTAAANKQWQEEAEDYKRKADTATIEYAKAMESLSFSKSISEIIGVSLDKERAKNKKLKTVSKVITDIEKTVEASRQHPRELGYAGKAIKQLCEDAKAILKET